MLAFQLSDLITVPFGWLLNFLYQFTGNYGVSMIIFAVIVQIVLLPITAKGKKSTMKMSRMQPKIQAIQQKYADDKQKQNEAIQQLQKEEGASMGCGGCLWSLVPLLILLPLYEVVREPMHYLLGVSAEDTATIVETIKKLAPEGLFSSNNYYDQVIAASANVLPLYKDAILEVLPNISQQALEGIDFGFLGIDLGATPSYNVFAWESFTWANVGAFLIPVISAGSQILQTKISQKSNDSVITNEKGVKDKETAEKSQTAQTTKTMLWMMPIMSLFIGFSVPAGLSLYWFVGGVIRTVEDTVLTKHYRRIYDAEDAIKLQRAMEEEAIEAEKERIRAERRAANPDGITTNTSKKKLRQQQQREEDAAKAAAAREYAAKKGIVIEEEEENTALSGIPERPYCKGRAYDPNRYSADTTEE